LELWCARYSIENSEELQTNSEPPDGSQTPFGTPLKKENPLYTGLIERITSTTFTRRMVGTCEPLSYGRVGHLPIFTIAVKLSPSLAPTLDIHDSGPCNK